MIKLLQVSLRQHALFIPASAMANESHMLTPATGMLVAGMARSGYGVSEALLAALNHTSPSYHAAIMQTVEEIMGLQKNWTPLVKGWNIPTGESSIDHIITFFANVFHAPGTTLPCGHIIPPATFPLERYNGCPFCGIPFEFARLENFKQGSTIKTLELWTMDDARNYLQNLLTSRTPLDATQIDDLKILLAELEFPDVKIGMKETMMTVIHMLVSEGKAEQAQVFFSSPTDILRYLWYRHTGFLQIIEPKTIINRKSKNNEHTGLYKSAGNYLSAKLSLRLKYTRRDCIVAATWLNKLGMDIEKICEQMHPKRSMWVRFIRALRLTEYSKRPGFEKLQKILHTFYNGYYEVWQGNVNQHRLRYDVNSTMQLLQQRPGLFARSLFANMLWFGSKITIAAFTNVTAKVPARLLVTLDMYADNYFDKEHQRMVKPLGGVAKNIPVNRLVKLYDDAHLKEMRAAVRTVCIHTMMQRFAATDTSAKTMYIDPVLFNMPVPVGDRADTIQDVSAVLTGTRFTVQGDTVRLFMQWGNGLPAQHLDMDLSCRISYESKTDICSFGKLETTGCKHSGDIRQIPDQVGTAEYIDVDIPALRKAKARYVIFTCNAYTVGSLSPNLVVGWMNSVYPMKVSEKSGVAYDPSCVQHQVRITNALTKGLAFGVLDVLQRKIIWLEMPFDGQLVQNMQTGNIEAMIRKLDSKLSIGRLLTVKAEAQRLQVIDSQDADEVYTARWAANHAAISQLLID